MSVHVSIEALVSFSRSCMRWPNTHCIVQRGNAVGLGQSRHYITARTRDHAPPLPPPPPTPIEEEYQGRRAGSAEVYNLALQLSQRPMNGNASMRYTRYNDTSSSSIPTTVQSATKLALVKEYGLTTRDLRVFDLPSPGFPHVLVREHAILVHLFDLRLLVKCDHVLLFHTAQKKGKVDENGSATAIPESSGGDRSSVAQVFKQNLERKLRCKDQEKEDGENGSSVSNTQPYELRVLEAALASATSVLEAEYSLTASSISTIYNPQADTDAAPLVSDKEQRDASSLIHALSFLSRRLATTEQAAHQIRTLTAEVLSDDEDMANMFLSDKARGLPHRPSDHQEVEYLFEAYFKASDAIVQESKRSLANIARTQETIRAALSVRRNQIMVLEARIEILMLALAGATLVAGWYGMNVVNSREESGVAFGVIVVGSLAGVAGVTWAGLRRLRKISRIRV
ncbi:hypothetical protein BJX64DRAFT_249085 [Aspergillus heterothallicus]